MQRDPKSYLWDAREAADAIAEFTRAHDLAAFRRDKLVRAAVERQFEIIGEALGQLAKIAPEIAAKIPDVGRIVAFRNILIHGYAAIDHGIVWRVIQVELPELHRRLVALLGRDGDPNDNELLSD